jgi:hypothetical protein
MTLRAVSRRAEARNLAPYTITASSLAGFLRA